VSKQNALPSGQAKQTMIKREEIPMHALMDAPTIAWIVQHAWTTRSVSGTGRADPDTSRWRKPVRPNT